MQYALEFPGYKSNPKNIRILLSNPRVRYCSQMARSLTEDVSTQVHRFWNAYCNGSKHILAEMYLPSAIVFGTFARRSEPVQLTLARRLRKVGNLKSSMSAQLGPIDVQAVGDIAVASYPYHFHLIKANSDGSRLDIDAPYARGTQIFQSDQNGALRIVHEHLSVAEPGKKVVIPRDDPSAVPSIPALRTSAGKDPGAANTPFRVSDTGIFPAVDAIAPEEVRDAIHGCWQALHDKSKERVEAF